MVTRPCCPSEVPRHLTCSSTFVPRASGATPKPRLSWFMAPVVKCAIVPRLASPRLASPPLRLRRAATATPLRRSTEWFVFFVFFFFFLLFFFLLFFLGFGLSPSFCFLRCLFFFLCFLLLLSPASFKNLPRCTLLHAGHALYENESTLQERENTRREEKTTNTVRMNESWCFPPPQRNPGTRW